MPAPGEYKTVQARILHYAQDIGWQFVPRDEALRARESSLFFSDSLLTKPGALLSREGDS